MVLTMVKDDPELVQWFKVEITCMMGQIGEYKSTQSLVNHHWVHRALSYSYQSNFHYRVHSRTSASHATCHPSNDGIALFAVKHGQVNTALIDEMAYPTILRVVEIPSLIFTPQS